MSFIPVVYGVNIYLLFTVSLLLQEASYDDVITEKGRGDLLRQQSLGLDGSQAVVGSSQLVVDNCDCGGSDDGLW